MCVASVHVYKGYCVVDRKCSVCVCVCAELLSVTSLRIEQTLTSSVDSAQSPPCCSTVYCIIHVYGCTYICVEVLAGL